MQTLPLALLSLTSLVVLGGCRQCGSDTQNAPPQPLSASEAPDKSVSAAVDPGGVAGGKSPALHAMPGGKADAHRSLGTNLTGITDYTAEQLFIDVIKTSRMFSATEDTWSDGRDLDLDENGWLKSLQPGQLARLLAYTETYFRKGEYVVLYDGKGKYRYEGSARLRKSSPGRDVIEIDPARGNHGLMLYITEVDPNDPLRNIRLLPPGGACSEDHARFCDATTPCGDAGECLSFEKHHEELVFNPDFLARTKPYGLLRFMTSMATNDSTIEHWSERSKIDDQTYTKQGGIPLEMMAKLVNELKVAAWFCIPHAADDDYVRNFARMAQAQIDPEIPIYVEYSNETWNAQFKQFHYLFERAESLGFGADFGGVLMASGQRSKEIFEIFEQEMPKDRLVRVVSAQSANVWTAEKTFEVPGLAEHTDAISMAPYFGWVVKPEDLDRVMKLGVDGLVEHTRADIIPTALEWTKQYAAFARKHGIALVAYEGGQHFMAPPPLENHPELNALLDEFNRDPRMKALYLEYLKGWKDAGGSWFAHLLNVERWSKWGRWGALENLDQAREDAPKYDAIMTFMEQNPRWW